MRRLTLLLGALLALCASTFFAPAASAGGPTSVLLVWDDGRSAALTYADPAYEQLMAAIGVVPGNLTPSAQPTPAGEPTGESITMTWLLHDVQVWRVDEVFPAASGGPVVGTRLVATGEGYPGLFDRTPTMHGASDPGALIALLDKLGGARTAVATVSPAPAPAPAAAAPVRAEATPTEPADGRLWWGIAGVLVGALAVTAVHRIRAPNARSEPDSESPKITVLS